MKPGLREDDPRALTAADYDAAIDVLLRARDRPDACPCAICHQPTHTARHCPDNVLRSARRYYQAQAVWKCFYCGIVCVTEEEAIAHFGLREIETPVCLRPKAA